MSKRSDLLVACMLGNRWRAAMYTVGASTCSAASPTPTDSVSRVHLENISYSIKNQSGASIHTVQVQVRGASGSVFATLEHLVPTSATANVAISNFAFAHPKRGVKLTVSMDTSVASCSYAVNAAGWIEDTNG